MTLPMTPPVVVDDSPVNIRAEHHEDDEDEPPTIFHPSDQLTTSGSQTTGSRPTTSRTLTDASPTSKLKSRKRTAEIVYSIRRKYHRRYRPQNVNRRMSTRSDGQDHTSDDDARSTALESFPQMSRSESMSSSVSTSSSTSSSGSAVGRMSLSSLGMGGGKGSSRKIVPLYNLAVSVRCEEPRCELCR